MLHLIANLKHLPQAVNSSLNELKRRKGAMLVLAASSTSGGRDKRIKLTAS